MLSKNLGVLVLLSSVLALGFAFAFGAMTPLFDPFSASGSYPCSGSYVDPDCDSPVNDGAGVVVTIDSLSMPVGETGSVTLSVFDVPEPGLGLWTIDVAFDALILDATSCAPPPGGVCNAEFTVSSVRTTGASTTGRVGDFDLGSITFDCVAEGTSALEINLTLFADATIGDPQDIHADTLDGEIICFGLPPVQGIVGDTSCDGVVNVIDAALLLQFNAGLLGSLPCADGADANGDGTINAIDVALILQFTAGLLGTLPP